MLTDQEISELMESGPSAITASAWHALCGQAKAANSFDAEIGKRVRRLVDGGPFDLTDSPKSFVDNCKQFVADAEALRGEAR